MDENGLNDDSELPDYFVTAGSLNYKERIKMQSIWQRHIDASISSTVNVPNDFSVEDVENLYIEAWRAGLKGITVFRDGCERAAILYTGGTNKKEDSESTDNVTSSELPRGFIITTSDDCIGKKRKLQTGCGSLHCTAFFDPLTGDLLETYLSKGSSGGCANFMVGLSRMMSLAARSGCDIHDIVDQLNSCGVCPSYAVRRATKHDTSKGSCCPMAVGNALLEMWEEMQNEIKNCSTTITVLKIRIENPTYGKFKIYHILKRD
jgi:ribonucleoside-diphosphate reductase alpha chain